MLNTIFESLKKELELGTKDKNHPFRYCTLATVGINMTARIRTVIIRDLDDELNLRIYTDKRTKKITHIKENKNVSLLFFDPVKRIQLRIDGYGFIEEDEKMLKEHWERISENSRKDYTTKDASGTVIESPAAILFSNEDYFSIVRIQPKKIDYVELQAHQKIRAYYSLLDSGKWEGSFMVP